MKNNMILMTALTFTLAVMTLPGFAQHGGPGIGAGIGGHNGVGAGAQVGGINAGAKTSSDVHTNTSVKTENSHRSDDHADHRDHGDAHTGTAIVTRIDRNPELASRVQAMLPSGMSMSTAAAGFKNEGQFLAALHASQNLGIPFTELKTRMTGSEHMSLGEAIKTSKPAISEQEAKEAAKKAEQQAKVTASTKATAKADIDDMR